MFGEIASRNVYLILSTSIINWCNISALLDVEKNSMVGNSPVQTYNESSLSIFYSINTNDIQHTYIVNIQRIRTKA